MSVRRLRVAGVIVAIGVLVAILITATLVDRRGPTVERISLSRMTDDGLALTHAALDVEFSEPVVQRSAEVRFRVSPSVDGSLSWVGDRTLIFTPADPFPLATDFRVWIERGFADRAGNLADRASEPFAFSTVDLPALTGSDPADEARQVALETTLSLTFDRLMDTQLTSNAIELDPARRLRTAWRGTTVLVTPEGGLAPGTRYRLTVDGSAADADGNELGRPISVDFTTIAVGMEATAVMPADGSAGAPPTGAIVVRFDRPIDPEGIGGAIRLTPEVGGSLSVEAPPNDVGGDGTDPSTMLVFRPDSALAPNTTYTVELRPAVVRTLDGEGSAAGRTWSFTTGSGLEPPQNQILFLSDRGGVRNVWAMNPDGTNVRQLSAELAPVSGYDVTADGRRILLAAGGEVVSLSLPDGRRTVLTASGAAEYAPRLVPDGTAVILGRRQRASGGDLGSWLVPLDGGGAERQLLPDGAPPLGSVAAGALPDEEGRPAPWSLPAAVSTDGELALLSGADGELRRVRLADGGITLTGLFDPVGRSTWLSQSSGFLVVARRGSDGSVGSWIVGRAGGLVAGPPVRGSPAAGSTGVLVGLDGTSGRHVAYLESLSGEPLVLTHDDLMDREPAFSPSADEVVFTRVSEGASDRSAGVWVVSVDGQGLRRLTPEGSDPRWLP